MANRRWHCAAGPAAQDHIASAITVPAGSAGLPRHDATGRRFREAALTAGARSRRRLQSRAPRIEPTPAILFQASRSNLRIATGVSAGAHVSGLVFDNRGDVSEMVSPANVPRPVAFVKHAPNDTVGPSVQRGSACSGL